MARTNLIYNSSFRQGTVGFIGVNGAALSISTSKTLFGAQTLQVTKSAQNGSGLQTQRVNVTGSLPYTFSAYVLTPITLPASEITNLTIKVTWYDSAAAIISESISNTISVTPSSSWTRLTGITASPASAVSASLAVFQVGSGSAGQVFYTDGFLFEQSTYVGGYLDNITQAEETRVVNKSLSEYKAPTIGGLPLDADIILGDLVLNTIDENNVVWVCTNLDGWYGLADPETIDITRGVEDGSYDVSGRTQARAITLSGSFLLPDPSMLGETRDKLVSATNLIRRGAWLRTTEEPTRAAFVRLSGKVNIQTVNARGRTDFSIGLKAADPIRYEWNDSDPDGITTVEVGEDPSKNRVNYMSNPAGRTITNTNTRWFGNSGGTGSHVSMLSQTDGPLGGPSSYIRKTWLTASPESGSSNIGISFPLIPATEGQVITLSGWFRTSAALKSLSNLRAKIYWINSPQVFAIGPAIVNPKPNTWYRVSVTGTVPVGVTTMGPVIDLDDGGNIDVGTYFDITGGLLELGTSVGTYFDGSYPDTDEFVYTYQGLVDFSPSLRLPGPVVTTVVPNIGTTDVTAKFQLTGPLGVGSTIYNATRDETITTAQDLRGAGPIGTVINKQLTNNVVTITTGAPHGLSEGDTVIVSGVGSPFDAVNETFTVTGAADLIPYTFNYNRVWPDIDSSASSGQVLLANNDVLTLDTYERSVTFNNEILNNRSRVETLIDWIKLSPGDNIIQLRDLPALQQVNSKSLTNNVVTIKTDQAHFFSPNEQIYVNLPTTAGLAIKSLTNNVITLTTIENHGFSVGDVINVVTTAISNIVNKSLTNNVVTMVTDILGSFSIGDTIVMALSTVRNVIAKAVSGNVVTLTTSLPHGYSVGDAATMTFPSTIGLTGKSIQSNIATVSTPTAHGYALGDSITIRLPIAASVVSKNVSGSSVVLTTSTPHGFSVGDSVPVGLPTTAILVDSRSMVGASGGSYLATINTTAAHNFTVGDVLNLSSGLITDYDVSARSATGTGATLTVGSHDISPGETITVTGVPNGQYNGTYTVTSVGATTINYNGVFTAEATVATSGHLVDTTISLGYNGTHVLETVPNPTSFTYLYYPQIAATSSTMSGTGGTVINVSNNTINGVRVISSLPSTTQFAYTI